MRLSLRFLLLSTLCFLFTFSSAQINEAGIGRFFKEYETFNFDTEKLYQSAKKSPHDFFEYSFALTEKYAWDLELHHTEIFSDNYILTEGNKKYNKSEISDLPIVLNGLGISSNDIRPTITVNSGFLYGFVKTRSGKIYFEPLNTFDKNAAPDEYIVYHEKDVIHYKGNFCAAREQDQKRPTINFEEEKENNSNYRDGACLTVEYAIANDSYVYASRGSSVASWNAGLVAALNTDYDDSFADEIRFVIVETYISQNTSQDQWGNTTDLLQLLTNFRNWNNNNATGFNNSNDLAGIWSKNAYPPGTIGWASTGVVCSQFRYHSLWDWGGSQPNYQNLVSHEIGHNFNLNHIENTSTWVMSRVVGGNTSWHPSSISAIKSYYDGLTCLGTCTGGPPPAPVAQLSATFISECNPTQVQMIDESTNDPTSWSWQFENGSPSSSSLQNPIVNFPGGGNYMVTLTVTNSYGSDTKITDMNLPVGPAPTANYSYSTSGNTVNFSNSSSEATSYNWTFGDGNTSTSTSPSHTFSGPGTYIVSLEALNDCGSDTETKTITIIDEVFAAFSASVTSECEGETIQFTNLSSGNISNYFWEFEGGNPSTSSAQNPSVTYNNSGTFNAKLTVSNASDSDAETKNNYISIFDTPTSLFTLSEDGYTVTFDNNAIGALGYSWSFGDGNTSTNANPTHTYSTHGSYTVSLTASNNCGSDVYIQTVILEEFVTASFESDVQTGCINQVVNYTSTSTGGVSNYFWEFENGIPSTSTDPNPSITYLQSGSFNTKLTVSNSSSSDVVNKTNYINITGNPNVNFTFSQNEYTFVFDNNTVGGLFYEWDFGDGNTSTSPNPSNTYTTPGTYTVRLVSENACGSEQKEQNVIIEEIVEANFESTITSVCEGQTVSFSTTSFGDIANHSWEFEGGNPSTSSDLNPIISYNNAGQFNVKLTVEGVYGTLDTKELINHISVSEYAEADFSYILDGLTIQFTNLSTGYDKITWDFGDGSSSSTDNPNHTFANEGNYTILLSAENDCGTDVKEVEIPVFDQLLANFQASKTSICPGEEIQLQDLSSGNPTDWNWVVEGSTMITAEDQNPMITIQEPGKYTVELTVSNTTEQHSKVISQYIEVMPMPEAAFSYTQEDLVFDFTNESENGLEFHWDFGDGSTSNLISPTHEYLEEGEYLVNLEVSNACETISKEIELAAYERLIAGFASNTDEVCASGEVEFIDRSTGNATAWSWSFPGGIPASSSEQNPVVIYETSGHYQVSLVVNNDTEQMEESIENFIQVIEKPEVSINTEIEEYNVVFSILGENANSAHWDFGDGNHSEDQNPNHKYDEEGFYNAKLIVSNNCGIDTIETEIKIEQEIQASISADILEICPEEAINFIAETSQNIVSWNWSFPGAEVESSSEKNPTVKYNMTGVYPVTLKVTSLFGEETIVKDDYVKVYDTPIANFEYEIFQDSVSFYNGSQQSSTYMWSIESIGATEEENPSVIFAEEKAYEVTLISSNNCSSDTIVKIIDLYEDAAIYANFSIAQNSYCLGDTIQFLDLSSDNIKEWNWKFPGGFPETSTEKNPKITYSSFGEYDVELSVSNGFNTRTYILEEYVQIMEKPVALFDLTQEGNKVEITSLSENASKHFWTLGDGNSTAGEDVTYIYRSNGEYIVNLKVENSCGVSMTEDTVEVVVYPKVGFSLDLAQGCSPLEVNFENRSAENAESIVWVLEGIENGIIAEDNPSVIYSVPGNYGIMVIASNSYGADTISLNSLIEVYESPSVEVTYEISGMNAAFSSNISNFDSLKWDLGDGTVSEDINPSHLYEEAGEYTVKLKVFLGECMTEKNIEITTLSTSIYELDEDSRAKVFPNPTSGALNLDLGKELFVQDVIVSDPLGRRLLVKNYDLPLNSLSLRMDKEMPSGNYIVMIYIAGEPPIVKKFVLAR